MCVCPCWAFAHKSRNETLGPFGRNILTLINPARFSPHQKSDMAIVLPLLSVPFSCVATLPDPWNSNKKIREGGHQLLFQLFFCLLFTCTRTAVCARLLVINRKPTSSASPLIVYSLAVCHDHVLFF